MTPTKYHRQTPRTEENETEPEPEEDGAGVETASGPTMEDLVEGIVETRVGELRAELAEVERQLEEIDNFARISLNERKVKQNEAKLSEFSESLTGFAEKAFNNLNELENRIDTHALLLAAIVDSLDEEIDLAEVRRHRGGNLVMDATPAERLASAVEGAGDARPIDTVEGIGPTYAERLEDAGFGSTAALAGAEPGEIATAADVPEERAAEWIDRAR